MNYLVAIDGSDNSKTAFFTVLKLMQVERDILYLVTIVEDPTSSLYAHVFGQSGELQKALDNVIASASEMLNSYAKMANEYKINVELVVATSSHVGEAICKMVEEKKIDYLAMGRRGLGTIKRLIVGSNSRYCVEHSKCNVLIVKKEWFSPEEEKSLNDMLAKTSICKIEPESTGEQAKQQSFTVEIIKIPS